MKVDGKKILSVLSINFVLINVYTINESFTELYKMIHRMDKMDACFLCVLCFFQNILR